MRNTVLEKSFAFATRIVKLRQHLQSQHCEYEISRQIVRSGTSIGANIAEAQQAQSRADFASKLNIALKEASETAYWLSLLYTTDYLTETEFRSIIKDCKELEYLLISIIKKLKQ